MAIEICKTNLYASSGPTGVLVCKTNLYVVQNTIPAFPTPNIDANKLAGLVVARFRTPEIDANKLAGLALINYPTEFIKANQFVGLPVFRRARPIQANKLAALVVCRGRRARPAISPWTFTIDGHEYLVINTYAETLVYDFHAERWSVYGSGPDAIWNPQVGQNWNANLGAILANLGGSRISNVICGDGTTSALYFLDPDLDEDYSSLGDPNKKFMRVITGQLVSRKGNDYTPLSAVQVVSSEGDTVAASDLTVELKYSDDAGHTYNSFGFRSVILGKYSDALEWRSLGSYRQPGRLLRLIDYGALKRIDDWTTPNG